MSVRKVRCPHCHRDFEPAAVPSSELSRRVRLVQVYVGNHFGLTVDELLARNSTQSLRLPRMVAYLVARDVTGASFPELGRLFKRNYTTLIQQTKRLRARAQRDAKLMASIEALIGSLSVNERAA
jgi:chromosomal replication initiator protein